MASLEGSLRWEFLSFFRVGSAESRLVCLGLIVLKNSVVRKSGRKSRILFLKSTRHKTLSAICTLGGKVFRRICLTQRDAEFFKTIGS